MKRFILPLLILLFVGSLFAVESAPSEVVGYFKIDVPVGSWTPVSMPFEIVDGSPAGVVGDNWASDLDYVETDVLININSGLVSYYYTGYGWDNDDPNFVEAGNFLWLNRTQPTANTNMFLLGKVNPQPISLNMAGQNAGGFTPFSINDAAPVDPAIMGFTTTEPDWDNYFVDAIICINDGRTAEYWGFEYGWNALDGEPFAIEPTKTYYYYSNSPTGWTWTYPTRGLNNPFSHNNLRSSK